MNKESENIIYIYTYMQIYIYRNRCAPSKCTHHIINVNVYVEL